MASSTNHKPTTQGGYLDKQLSSDGLLYLSLRVYVMIVEAYFACYMNKTQIHRSQVKYSWLFQPSKSEYKNARELQMANILCQVSVIKTSGCGHRGRFRVEPLSFRILS